MTIDKLLEHINLGEDSDIEFKSAKGGLPKSLWESLSAFANSSGGYIVLGVDETDGKFHLGSLGNPDGALKMFWDAHNNTQKLSASVCSEQDVSLMHIATSTVMIIHVPMTHRKQRPIFINGNPYTGTYKRNYEGDYRCSESEVRQMMRDASDEAQDYSIVEHYGLKDVDSETLKAYRNRFRSRQEDHPYLALEDLDFLKKIGAYRVDRHQNIEGLTRAGLLFFGTESSIMEVLPYFHLDYQEQLSKNPDERWSYRLTQDGTWECNLYNFYYRVYNRIIQDIEVPFALDSNGIRIGETHVHEGLRETLANTLMHADYHATKSITILKKPNEFVFQNPGRLRIDIKQLQHGGMSDPRNPYIQKMFQFLGVGEKAGSGFVKIIRAWEEQKWKMPQVEEKIGLDMTIITLSKGTLLQENSGAKVADSGGIPAEYRRIPADQERAVFDYLTLNGVITTKKTQELLQIKDSRAREVLKKMADKNLIVKFGNGKNTYYERVL